MITVVPWAQVFRTTLKSKTSISPHSIWQKHKSHLQLDQYMCRGLRLWNSRDRKAILNGRRVIERTTWCLTDTHSDACNGNTGRVKNNKKEANKKLTLLIMSLSEFRRNWLISWMLVPWHIASRGHQKPWLWLCRIKSNCLRKIPMLAHSITICTMLYRGHHTSPTGV